MIKTDILKRTSQWPMRFLLSKYALFMAPKQ